MKKDLKQIKEMLEIIFHRINTIESHLDELANSNESIRNARYRRPAFVESLSNLYDWIQRMNYQKDQTSLNQDYLDKYQSYNSDH